MQMIEKTALRSPAKAFDRSVGRIAWMAGTGPAMTAGVGPENMPETRADALRRCVSERVKRRVLFLAGKVSFPTLRPRPNRSMRPEIFKLPLPAGTLLIGHEHQLARVAGATEIDAGSFASWVRGLLARADSWRLRSAAVALGAEEFDPRQRTEQRLQDQIARMLETGRLSACFLPLFRDDSHALNDAGPLRVHQLGGGPATNTPPPEAPRASPPPPPPPKLTRPAPQDDKEFANEPDQVDTLVRAAKDGTPFCEICARGGR
jgi:hypothetical protein